VRESRTPLQCRWPIVATKAAASDGSSHLHVSCHAFLVHCCALNEACPCEAVVLGGHSASRFCNKSIVKAAVWSMQCLPAIRVEAPPVPAQFAHTPPTCVQVLALPAIVGCCIGCLAVGCAVRIHTCSNGQRECSRPQSRCMTFQASSAVPDA
jgi:hypothetical protein